MKKKKLYPFFLISLFFALFGSALFPPFRFHPFAPFLALYFSHYPYSSSLWIATSCGLLFDLIATASPFGLSALSYVGATLFLYRFRTYFVEKAIGLASFTFLFSLISTAISLALFPLFGMFFPITLKGIFSDLFLMPLFDALCSFLWFSCPILAYHLGKRFYFRFLFLYKEFKKKRKKTNQI